MGKIKIPLSCCPPSVKHTIPTASTIASLLNVRSITYAQKTAIVSIHDLCHSLKKKETIEFLFLLMLTATAKLDDSS